MKTISQERKKQLARIAHEANKGLCESVGDFSQKSWDDAPKHNHTSAITGVEALIENPNLTSEDSHKVWMDQKIADGWKYGEKKDAGKKTHPSLVPFDQLSPLEQYKDALFKATVKTYLDFMQGK